jgi:hypothetical protein
MLNHIYLVREKLTEELKRIENEETDLLKRAELSIFFINKSLIELKEYIRKNKFSSQEDEVLFLKKSNHPFIVNLYIS